jgi:hypothetical protein
VSTIPANAQAEIAPWGSIPVTVCWGTQGGPYNTASAANPLPVATGLPAAAALGDATANPTTVLVGAMPFVFNGATWNRVYTASALTDGDAGNTHWTTSELLFNGASYDHKRGNIELTLLASAARTSTTASADQTNYNGTRIQVILNVTANASVAGIQLQIQGKDPISGNYFYLTPAPSAVTGTGTFVYELCPGEPVGAAGAGITQRTSGVLPRTFRVNVTHGDASSVTYSVAAALLL